MSNLINLLPEERKFLEACLDLVDAERQITSDDEQEVLHGEQNSDDAHERIEELYDKINHISLRRVISGQG